MRIYWICAFLQLVLTLCSLKYTEWVLSTHVYHLAILGGLLSTFSACCMLYALHWAKRTSHLKQYQ